MTIQVDRPAIAFIAGVIDARAHIELVTRRAEPSPRVRVTTRRINLLTWLADRTGTTVRDDSRSYQRRACAEHCGENHVHAFRQSAYWKVDGARAAIVLDACLPYLVDRRPVAVQALSLGISRWRPYTELTEQMRRLGWPIPDHPDHFRARAVDDLTKQS